MSEIELEIGDVVQIGGYSVTVIEVENGEVTFRIDQCDHADESLVMISEGAIPR